MNRLRVALLCVVLLGCSAVGSGPAVSSVAAAAEVPVEVSQPPEAVQCPAGCAWGLAQILERLTSLEKRLAAVEENVYRPGLPSTGKLETLLIE